MPPPLLGSDQAIPDVPAEIWFMIAEAIVDTGSEQMLRYSENPLETLNSVLLLGSINRLFRRHAHRFWSRAQWTVFTSPDVAEDREDDGEPDSDVWRQGDQVHVVPAILCRDPDADIERAIRRMPSIHQIRLPSALARRYVFNVHVRTLCPALASVPAARSLTVHMHSFETRALDDDEEQNLRSMFGYQWDCHIHSCFQPLADRMLPGRTFLDRCDALHAMLTRDVVNELWPRVLNLLPALERVRVYRPLPSCLEYQVIGYHRVFLQARTSMFFSDLRVQPSRPEVVARRFNWAHQVSRLTRKWQPGPNRWDEQLRVVAAEVIAQRRARSESMAETIAEEIAEAMETDTGDHAPSN